MVPSQILLPVSVEGHSAYCYVYSGHLYFELIGRDSTSLIDVLGAEYLVSELSNVLLFFNESDAGLDIGEELERRVVVESLQTFLGTPELVVLSWKLNVNKAVGTRCIRIEHEDVVDFLGDYLGRIGIPKDAGVQGLTLSLMSNAS